MYIVMIIIINIITIIITITIITIINTIIMTIIPVMDAMPPAAGGREARHGSTPPTNECHYKPVIVLAVMPCNPGNPVACGPNTVNKLLLRPATCKKITIYSHFSCIYLTYKSLFYFIPYFLFIIVSN